MFLYQKFQKFHPIRKLLLQVEMVCFGSKIAIIHAQSNLWYFDKINKSVWKMISLIFFLSFLIFFFLLLTIEMFLCCVVIFFPSFFFKFQNERKIKYIFSDFILHIFKKYKFKSYHSTEWHILALLYKVCPVDCW